MYMCICICISIHQIPPASHQWSNRDIVLCLVNVLALGLFLFPVVRGLTLDVGPTDFVAGCRVSPSLPRLWLKGVWSWRFNISEGPMSKTSSKEYLTPAIKL